MECPLFGFQVCPFVPRTCYRKLLAADHSKHDSDLNETIKMISGSFKCVMRPFKDK